jgi:diketogulonate reductase-like aldo/keto reductase
MSMNNGTRREFLAAATAGTALAAGLLPRTGSAQAQQFTLPTRRIPLTGEMLPVIGLGSSKAVQEIGTAGAEPLREVLLALVEMGGKVVDTWPRDDANDAAFGRVAGAPELRERLFVTSKIDREGAEAGEAQFHATRRLYDRETIDLVQIFSLTDLETHWPNLKDWKTSGFARYVGVTVAEERLHARLEQFLERESPDFVQVNYSITEPQAENRLLPLAADKGAAVLINRPFMNGAYFRRLENVPLPDWTRELGCESWAQFSLKYIVAHPAVTCVLTETTNPAHMRENARAAAAPLPDEAARRRMRAFLETL